MEITGLKQILVRGELLRKIAHGVLCLLLALPFVLDTPPWAKTVYYASIVLTAAYVNALIIKQPLLKEELRVKFRNSRKKVLKSLTAGLPASIQKKVLHIDEVIDNLEVIIEEQLKSMERTYERRGGYIGITHGAIGVFVAYTLFQDWAFYGIAALLTVDPVAAIVGRYVGRTKIPYTQGGSLEGALAGFTAYFLVLYVLGVNPTYALAIAAAAELAELFGIEDNLVIPVAASAAAYFLHSPLIP